MTMVRTRWAAIGAAVAVALGAGGFGLGQAAGSADVDPVYVALSAPCRVVDTRSGSPVGAGDANALTVQITGENGECTDDLAIPADAVAVAANVTAIRPTGAPSGRSFFTVYPADASRPNTSNLNFVNDQPPTPNKVDVGLSTDGRIEIYNDQGTAHAAVDVFGYYVDHDHDDRYYTKAQLDTSLGALNAAIGTKANSTNVYTKAEIDTSLGSLNAAIGTKANSTSVYTKAEVDSALAGKASASNTYTKSEVDFRSPVAWGFLSSTNPTSTSLMFGIASVAENVAQKRYELTLAEGYSLFGITVATLEGDDAQCPTGVTVRHENDAENNRFFVYVLNANGTFNGSCDVNFVTYDSPLP